MGTTQNIYYAGLLWLLLLYIRFYINVSTIFSSCYPNIYLWLLRQIWKYSLPLRDHDQLALKQFRWCRLIWENDGPFPGYELLSQGIPLGNNKKNWMNLNHRVWNYLLNKTLDNYYLYWYLSNRNSDIYLQLISLLDS